MLTAQPLALPDAPVLHRLYRATPQYFEILGTPIPSVGEVRREVELALLDPRRRLEVLFESDPDAPGRAPEPVGALDYKLHYPSRGDVTINLLLIAEHCQGRRLGSRALHALEERLPGGVRRVLASVLGNNERGARFWQRHGYSFAIDARPVMTWYAKDVHVPLAHPRLAKLPSDAEETLVVSARPGGVKFEGAKVESAAFEGPKVDRAD